MARNKQTPFNEWETALPTGVIEDGYTRISRTLLKHEKYKSLPYGARALYIAMVNVSGGGRSFSFPRKKYEEYGYTPPAFARAVKALIENGFIISISGKAQRVPNTFKFINRWKSENS